MRYALIREMDVSNGRGVGVSLFVQGCHFHCKGCFNPETWDFSGGKEWTKEVEDKFVNLIRRPFIKRVSILGGEPLADENVSCILNLLRRIRSEFGYEKSIWLYTGYTFGAITSGLCEDEPSQNRLLAASLCDYLVDGPFELDKQDLHHHKSPFAGSTNQRVVCISNEPKFYAQGGNTNV